MHAVHTTRLLVRKACNSASTRRWVVVLLLLLLQLRVLQLLLVLLVVVMVYEGVEDARERGEGRKTGPQAERGFARVGAKECGLSGLLLLLRTVGTSPGAASHPSPPFTHAASLLHLSLLRLLSSWQCAAPEALQQKAEAGCVNPHLDAAAAWVQERLHLLLLRLVVVCCQMGGTRPLVLLVVQLLERETIADS